MSMWISLGHNCGPAIELQKRGLLQSRHPFDWARTTHAALLQCLDTDFHDLLRDVHLQCRVTNMQFAHDGLSDLAAVRALYQRRVRRLRALRGRPGITFLRTEPSPLPRQATEIDAALRRYGFVEFRLLHLSAADDVYDRCIWRSVFDQPSQRPEN